MINLMLYGIFNKKCLGKNCKLKIGKIVKYINEKI